MKPIRLMLAMTAALGLSACASVETATRNAPVQAPAIAAAPVVEAGATLSVKTEPYNITQINVRVPRQLSVSEANTFKPRADIVWREDPLGDRYVQIETLLSQGLAPLTQDQIEGRRVVVDVQITKFHALTQKTRYTVGGTHDIHFFLSVLDAQTGEMLGQPRLIETELEAYGGAKALEAMSRGETQKLRIQRHVLEVLRRELGVQPAPIDQQPLQLSALSSRGL